MQRRRPVAGRPAASTRYCCRGETPKVNFHLILVELAVGPSGPQHELAAFAENVVAACVVGESLSSEIAKKPNQPWPAASRVDDAILASSQIHYDGNLRRPRRGQNSFGSRVLMTDRIFGSVLNIVVERYR